MFVGKLLMLQATGRGFMLFMSILNTGWVHAWLKQFYLFLLNKQYVENKT